ncbi:LacI family DNA-binding transcriptional regulator [Nibricoccus aquaticus]|uniref:LacI family DNA-binding transcriptional regulator n=1 Tax=Nibricoccus aquaticus TaxID=2576891 RepID=UPI0010FF4DE3|nr:LacI family DNA-binding transcriptional regulator [Nibricoccus aquaticus]
MSSLPRKVSQAQIARDLGVSQALVSLVLNGRRDGINAATYERIWQHTALCGYRAKGMNPAAAPAAALHPQIGAILRPSLTLSRLGNYFSHVQHGLHAGLEASGGSTAFLGSADEFDAARLARLFPTGHRFHGLAIFGEVSPAFLRKLLSRQPRLVSISACPDRPGHTVNGDEKQSLDLLVQHLKKLGHRRIGWLGGKAGQGRHETRRDAFHAALLAAGLASDPRYETARTEADRAEGAEAIHKLLPLARRADFPTAFICYNSLMATGATLALNHAGWETPSRLSIVGADLPRPPTKREPAVTGAGTCAHSLGHAAASLLLESAPAATLDYQHLTLPARLIIGETSGPAPSAFSSHQFAELARA